jgi:hypothetical protein
MGEFDAVSNNRPALIKAPPKPLSKNQYLIILITFCSSFLIYKNKKNQRNHQFQFLILRTELIIKAPPSSCYFKTIKKTCNFHEITGKEQWVPWRFFHFISIFLGWQFL